MLKDITGVRSWFGLVEQCTYAFSKTDTMGPFRHLLKPDAPFLWDEELQRAFKHSKEEIIRQVERGIETFDTVSPSLPTAALMAGAWCSPVAGS